MRAPDARDPRVRGELDRIAWRADPRAALVTVAVAPLAAIALDARGVDARVAIGWALAVAGLALARSAVARTALRRPAGSKALRGLRAAWLAVLGAGAMTWGSAAIALLPRDAIGAGLVGALWLSVASIATPLLAGSRPAIYVSLVPSVLPLVWGLARMPDAAAPLLAACGAVLSLLVLRLALERNELLASTESARILNESLVEQMRLQVDITERAIHDKTRFLAAAAHDLRQPLHALGLFCAALDQRMKDVPERPLVRNMMQSIEALESSFGAMLDISRLDAGIIQAAPEPFAVRDLFQRLYLQFNGEAEKRGLQLRFRPARRHVVSDPQLLERVVANLVQNALRYTRAGGVVVVARRRGEAVALEVWDTGFGVPPDQQELIFEEFYQVDNPERDRARGLGMGLAIVRRLCRLLGHSLQVRSTPGRGSMFRVVVPATRAGLEVAGATEAALGEATRPPRIDTQATLVLVDDERAIREAATELLRPLRIEVLAAGTIAEAVALVGAHERPVDLILSDWRLRGEENGVEAVRALRRATGEATPAALVTGDTSPDVIRLAHEQGLIILHKPLQPKQLLEIIERLTR
ncbi:MAG TPA: ATP-binding protein [Burkholderiaceae bacterium]|nr:ATP-binding protein [Burkholderiaceae bacterium]